MHLDLGDDVGVRPLDEDGAREGVAHALEESVCLLAQRLQNKGESLNTDRFPMWMWTRFITRAKWLHKLGHTN